MVRCIISQVLAESDVDGPRKQKDGEANDGKNEELTVACMDEVLMEKHRKRPRWRAFILDTVLRNMRYAINVVCHHAAKLALAVS